MNKKSLYKLLFLNNEHRDQISKYSKISRKTNFKINFAEKALKL